MEVDRKSLRTILYYCWLRKLNEAAMAQEINQVFNEAVVEGRIMNQL